MKVAPIVARALNPNVLQREFAAVAAFLARTGVPGIGPDWFHHVGRAAWQEKNPRVYRVYERAGEIVGFLGVAPLRRKCLEELLSGKRSLWWEVTAEDILGPVAHRRAAYFGGVLLIDAYSGMDRTVDEQVRWDMMDELSRTNLLSLLAHSSTPRAEAACEALGLRRVIEGPILPSGSRRWLWAVRPGDLAHYDLLAVPPPPLLWHVFDAVRSRFTPRAAGLGLTQRQQQVAYLYYCEGRTLADTARQLGCRIETIRTHLREIRAKSSAELEEMPASPERIEEGTARRATAITSYLREHPWEVRGAAALFEAELSTP